LYGGRRTRQGNEADAKSRRSDAFARACALLLGLAATLRNEWYDARPGAVQIEWLAPRGRLEEPPAFMVWRSSGAIEALQLECRLDDGRLLPIRRLAVDESCGRIEFTNDERTALAQVETVVLTAVAIASDGRGLAPPVESVVTFRRGLSTPAAPPGD
jgi:hypothetical protein